MEYEENTPPQDEYLEAQTTWTKELQAAHRELEDFHTEGDKIVSMYSNEKKSRSKKRFPLFNANVSILQNALFSRIPKPDVARREADPDDQVGRVAAVIVQRALSTELDQNSDFRESMQNVIKDMLITGLGAGWVRYVAEEQQITDSEDLGDDGTASSPVIQDQRTVIDYVYWKDLRWSPCRTWEECRWIGRRVYVDETEAEARFGARAEWLSFSTSKDNDNYGASNENDPQNNVEPQAAIWEIWDKESKKVFFICESCQTALDIQDDFLGLPDFFPTGKPLFASTVTTSKLIPIADFTVLRDQYTALNEVNARIDRLVKASRIAGVYDEAEPAVKALFEGTAEHQLIPVKNFAGFAEKGGLKGSMDIIPLENFTQNLQTLSAYREVLKQQIYELTGISDIVRGASNPYETAAAQGMKAQYASIRLQGLQTMVAEYITSLIKNKAFLMVKFYEPQRLMQRAGTLPQTDQQYVGPALQLLADQLTFSLKLEVSSDSLQQPNWAKEQQEKAQVMGAVSQFMQQAIPAVKQFPEMAPLMLHLMKWSLSGSPGSREVEGVIDSGLKAVMSGQTAEAKEDPQVTLQKQQSEMQQQKSQVEFQFKQQEAAQKLQLEREKMMAELAFEREKFAAEMAMKREIEMTKAKQKNVPQVVTGNLGLDQEDLGALLTQILSQMQQSTLQTVGQMQQNTLEAITAIANEPQEPASVVVRRNTDGSLTGTIQ